MLGHTDIQTTLINMHERDGIVTRAEQHISTCSRPLAPCVRIDVVRVFQNLGARDERVPWKCVRNIHKHLKRPL